MKYCINEDEEGAVRCFFIEGERNPCGCGSNCFHYVDYGTEIIGVCNACGRGIYGVKEEYLEQRRSKYKWAEKNHARSRVYEKFTSGD